MEWPREPTHLETFTPFWHKLGDFRLKIGQLLHHFRLKNLVLKIWQILHHFRHKNLVTLSLKYFRLWRRLGGTPDDPLLIFPESEPSRKKNGPLKKYIKIGFCRNISNKYDSGGVWIAELYHTRRWSSVCCTMPWALSLGLGDGQTLFWTQAQHLCILHDSIWFILYYYFSVKFVMWIVKQKIENKIKLFLKKYVLDHLAIRVSIEV